MYYLLNKSVKDKLHIFATQNTIRINQQIALNCYITSKLYSIDVLSTESITNTAVVIRHTEYESQFLKISKINQETIAFTSSMPGSKYH